MSGKTVIIVQGGAGTLSTVKNDGVKLEAYEGGVRSAALAGWKALQAGGNAVDAVEAAVAYMEENPVFNAGRGSYLTETGEVEMDASIMDGTSFKAGAVCAVKNILTPVKLSRIVMDKSNHCLLAGEGATAFAIANGMKPVYDKELMTEKAKIRYREVKEFMPSVDDEFVKGSKLNELRSNKNLEQGHDTVGAVCLDSHGNVAYATSTGGINAKMPGRVGDSPLIGCGGYADSAIGGVSTTGHGESFMKTNLALRIVLGMESGKSPQEAAADGMKLMATKVGGTGGVIVLNNQGDIGIYFSSEGMSWAYVSSEDQTNIHYGIYRDEHKVLGIDSHVETLKSNS